MKDLRHLPALLASCLLVIAAVPLARATPLVIDWNGANSTAAIDSTNWSSPPAADGTENFRFGAVTTTRTSIVLPSGIPIKAKDLIFSDSNTSPYTFTFSGTSASDSALSLAGNVDVAANGTVTIADTMAFLLTPNSHTVTVGSNATLTVNAPAVADETDGGSIEKLGAGKLVLNGNNAFTGGLTLTQGTIEINADSGYTESPEYQEWSPVGLGAVSLSKDTTFAVGTAAPSTITLWNEINLSNSEGRANIEVAAGKNLALQGDIFGGDGIAKVGAGSLSLYGDGSFSGGVSVQAGSLLIGTSSDHYSEGELFIDSGPAGTGTIELFAGTTLGVAADPDSELELANHIFLAGTAGTSVSFDTANGDLTLVGNIEGNSDIVKTGSGTLTIDPIEGYNNSFNGKTSVQAGTLAVYGDTSLGYGNVTVENTGTLLVRDAELPNVIEVKSGGTLAGAGNAYEAIIRAGGTLQVGTFDCPVESLWLSELTLEGQSTFVFGVKGDGEGGFDNGKVYVENSATLTLSGIDASHQLTLRVISEGVLTGLQMGQTYSIDFLYFNSQSGADLSLANVYVDKNDFLTEFPDVSFVSLVNNDGYYTLQFTPVPEPSTYALLALGAGLTGLAAWRKRRKA